VTEPLDGVGDQAIAHEGDVERERSVVDMTLEEITQNLPTYERSVAAFNHSSPEVLMGLASDPAGVVQRSVAANPRAPAEVLEMLGASEGEWIREAVASNPSAPVDVLKVLAKDQKTPVRLAVASNPQTPLDVLVLLTNDKIGGVRNAVRTHPNMPASMASEVAKSDADTKVDRILATTEPRELDPFLDDSAMRVRYMAWMRRLELGDMTLDDINVQLVGGTATTVKNEWLRRAAESGITASDELVSLIVAIGDDDYLSRGVGWGLRLNEERLVALVSDRTFKRTAWAVASGDQPLTEPVLRALASASSFSIPNDFSLSVELPVGVIATTGYISYHPQILVALHPDTPQDVLDKLRKARSKYVRAAILDRPDTTLDNLRTASKDKEPTVRVAVARHPLADEQILMHLALDGDASVRDAVREHPAVTDEIKAAVALSDR